MKKLTKDSVSCQLMRNLIQHAVSVNCRGPKQMVRFSSTIVQAMKTNCMNCTSSALIHKNTQLGCNINITMRMWFMVHNCKCSAHFVTCKCITAYNVCSLLSYMSIWTQFAQMYCIKYMWPIFWGLWLHIKIRPCSHRHELLFTTMGHALPSYVISRTQQEFKHS